MHDTLPPRNWFSSTPPAEGGGVRSAGLRSDTEELEALAEIGPYRVVRRLGLGGMGIVYQCEDQVLRRHVAVKVIRERYAGDEHYRRRFHREAQAVASVSHPSVAHVYGFGEFQRGERSLLYLAMEYVDGPSVETILHEKGRIPLRDALRIAREAALGLGDALAKGIIHRDVKPSNLLVTPAGGVKIVDFGLAKEVGASSSVTDEGIVLGTPHYISPEQGRGKTVDHRSDIYSLGATLYHMITGRPPFEGDSQVSVIVAHVNDAPLPPHQIDPGVPEPVSRVVLRMLAKATAERYPDYRSLIDDIEALEREREPPFAAPPPVSPFAETPSAGTPLAGTDFPEAPISRTPTPPGPGRRRAAGRTPAGRLLRAAPWLFLAAAFASVAAGLWALGYGQGAPEPDVSWLGSWHERLGDGRDLIQASFSPSSGDPTAADRARRLFSSQPGREAEDPPRLTGGLLRWDHATGPILLGLVFERVDDVRVLVGPTKGPFDLGIGIADPLAPERRSLEVRLRLMETTTHPVLALRCGAPVPVVAVAEAPGESVPGQDGSPHGVPPPVASVGPGPFEVSISLEPAATTTRIRLRIVRRHEGRAHYRATFEVPGTDWGGGFVILRTESPVRPFTASLERLLVSGRLAADPNLEALPWRS